MNISCIKNNDVYVDVIKNVLRKVEYLFKRFGEYLNRHCNNKAILNVINKSSLISRRNISCLTTVNVYKQKKRIFYNLLQHRMFILKLISMM